MWQLIEIILEALAQPPPSCFPVVGAPSSTARCKGRWPSTGNRSGLADVWSI